MHRIAAACLAMLLSQCGLDVARAALLEGNCRQQLERATPASTPRDITTQDLVGLRDVGRPQEEQGDRPIVAVSPDGNIVAFQLRRADAAANSYCLAMVVVNLRGPPAPRFVDVGGEVILDARRSPTSARWLQGVLALIVPLWRPDSSGFAYLRRDKGVTQVWLADLGSGTSRPVTASPVDVDAFVWSADGRSIIYRFRPRLIEGRTRLQQEARSGYLYDSRFMVEASREPNLADAPDEYRKIDVSEDGQEELDPQLGASAFAVKDEAPEGAQLSSVSRDAQAWTYALRHEERVRTGSDDPSDLYSRTGLRFAFAGKTAAHCSSLECDRIFGLWLATGGRQLYYLRREGWAGVAVGLYGWRAGEARPKLILRSPKHYVGCELAGRELICGEEAAAQPRRLVRIDLNTGAVAALFDPNPEISNLRPGKVTPLRWSNAAGFRAFGSLVTPETRGDSKRLPLIVVQYEARGFLRGGTGDQYPVYPLVSKGFAVLVVNRPNSWSRSLPEADAADYEARLKLNSDGKADRKNVQASLDAAIDLALATGQIDPNKIGITGMSEGAASAVWALIHSKRFAAAAISNCCDDEFRMSYHSARGVAIQLKAGFPYPGEGGGYYRDTSLTQQAATMDTPLLMQISDIELLAATPTITALQARSKPAEMYVYPNEFHVKWQPAHRQVIYDRSVDWFNFWLQCREDAAPIKTAQYERWRALRANTDKPACTAN